MVSVCGMRLFFVFYHSVDHWSDRSALAGADGGGIDGTAGTCRPVGNHGSERIAGFFSGTGIHFCLCVYHGWLYDGTVPRNSGSAFYEKTEKGWLAGAVCLAFSMGIYQAYLPFAILLCVYVILLFLWKRRAGRRKRSMYFVTWAWELPEPHCIT